MKKKRLLAIAQEVAQNEFILQISKNETVRKEATKRLDHIIEKYKIGLGDMMEVDNAANEILEKMLDNYKKI